ncbi:uncharacterized protein BDV17DRAFT_248997 [Aspergillus undulatus]|uniref:uncharacterized protein n=1 Tax=Aspergillus undulatus TaxID=1810928 RepID=UPI003CCDBBDC
MTEINKAGLLLSDNSQRLGALLGTMLFTVWVQIAMSLVPPRVLDRVFPKVVTGTLLLLIGMYLVGNGMQN